MSLYSGTLPQMAKMLRNLEGWLEKAEAYAASKKFDPATLLSARLAPDQYALVRQVQSAADAAKFLGARLASKEPPKDPDTETTFEELYARIKKTLAFLDTIGEADVKGAAERLVPLSFAKGKGATGAAYANEFAMPNFYFHVVHAYAILRHNGVDLGKLEFIGPVTLHDLPA